MRLSVNHQTCGRQFHVGQVPKVYIKLLYNINLLLNQLVECYRLTAQ